MKEPTSSRIRRPELTLLLALLLVLVGPAATPQGADPHAATLARIQRLLDGDEVDKALEELKPLFRGGKPSAMALLLRSTAQIMAGDTKSGFDDLERALALDPTLRQGWLNLAGLEIAEQHYDAAYKDLIEAQKLDPAALDNHLNLGAVVVLQGKLDLARQHFDQYLKQNPDSAEAAYLVASNYALGGFEKEAVANLEKAIRLDEHMRLRARSDERFLGLQGTAYRRLLETDSYQPSPDALTATAAFKKPYDRADPQLVYAVLDVLKAQGMRYDATVEATENWALVWGDMRIKIFTQSDGNGVVSLSAPAGRFSADEWQRRSQKLFRALYEELERPSILR